MDLIICDTPDNCEVPGVKATDETGIPRWNQVRKPTYASIFHIADAMLADSGFLLLFVPAEEQSDLMNPKWAKDWEVLRTFYVINHRPLFPQWVSNWQFEVSCLFRIRFVYSYELLMQTNLSPPEIHHRRRGGYSKPRC